MTDLKPLSAVLEPLAVDRDYAYQGHELTAASQAVSLKRIADSLEKLANPLHAVKDAWPADSTEAQPDADGWIPWSGGECPVGPATIVAVRFRADRDFDENTPQRADVFRWDHLRTETFSGNGDIVAYRLHTNKGTTE